MSQIERDVSSDGVRVCIERRLLSIYAPSPAGLSLCILVGTAICFSLCVWKYVCLLLVFLILGQTQSEAILNSFAFIILCLQWYWRQERSWGHGTQGLLELSMVCSKIEAHLTDTEENITLGEARGQTELVGGTERAYSACPALWPMTPCSVCLSCLLPLLTDTRHPSFHYKALVTFLSFQSTSFPKYQNAACTFYVCVQFQGWPFVIE